MPDDILENHDIKIRVKSTYLDEQSQPDRSRFAFAYSITIENNSDTPAQLISRHWIITDTKNNIQDVKGDGVIGKQPRIMPRESFSYTSAAVIETTAGTMEGSYKMQRDNGENFIVTIPTFSLTKPQALH